VRERLKLNTTTVLNIYYVRYALVWYILTISTIIININTRILWVSASSDMKIGRRWLKNTKRCVLIHIIIYYNYFQQRALRHRPNSAALNANLYCSSTQINPNVIITYTKFLLGRSKIARVELCQ
jgi:hypothetical protein